MTVVRLSLCAGVLLPVLSYAAPGGYGDRSFGADSLPERESEAVYYYKKGLKQRDKAWKYEEKAAGRPDGDRRRKNYLEEAQEAYEDAIGYYKRALNHDNRLYQAYSSLGYALRKIGSLDESVIAYQNALFINPDYPEAIEYLAETRLHLGEYDAVTAAHRKLVELEPEYARQLAQAIDEWLQQQNVADDPQLQRFARWARSIHTAAGPAPDTRVPVQ